MQKSRTYRALAVKQVDVESLTCAHWGEEVVAGLDVGKESIWVVIRLRDGTCLRPWRVSNPWEVGDGVGLLKRMGGKMKLKVAMESSGTYADALRQALSDAGLEVHRVSSKATHDWAEAFDGVPSQHDGKDAGVVAELCAMGKGVVWRFDAPGELEAQMAYWVDRMDAARRVQQVWCGRLESRLARHWPEVCAVLKVSSPTLHKALIKWASPAALGADPQAATTLRRLSSQLLSQPTIDRLVREAKQSVGVRLGAWEERRMRDDAAGALSAHRDKRQAARRLRELAAGHPAIMAMGQVVGVPTACVLWSCVGDPRRYDSGAAYRKAMGLNLAERSSGMYQGELHISKRGKSLPRRFLYFAAMRYASKEPVKSWYLAKKRRDGEEGMRGIVAIMRKLPLAVWTAAQGEPFDPQRLFNSIMKNDRTPARR